MDQQKTYPQQHNKDELDLGYLLAVCWDYRRSIISITALITAIGIFNALLAQPVYRANALLQVESRSDGLGSNLGIPTLGQGQTASSTQSEILRSRMILSRASAQAGLDLVVEPVTVPVIGEALIRYGFTRPDFAEGMASVWAGETIHVEELQVDDTMLGKPLVLTVLDKQSFQLTDATGLMIGTGHVGERLVLNQPTVEILVRLIDAPAGSGFIISKRDEVSMTSYLQSRFTVTPRGETGILELTLEGGDRNELVRSLDAIADVYLIQNINRQAAEAESRLEFLEGQIPVMLDNLTAAEDALNSYRLSQDSVDLSFETQTMLSQLVTVESQLNQLDVEESELARRFTTSHPSYQTLQDRRAFLQSTFSKLETQAENLPETQRQVLRLNRDVEVSQRIYFQMLNTMQELRIAKAGSIGNVRILDRALASAAPFAPKRNLIVLAYAVTGLLISFLIVAFRKIINRGLESVGQLESIGLPIYGTVPLSDYQVKILSRKKAGETGVAEINKWVRRLFNWKTSINSDPFPTNILAWTNPLDISIEALRSLRTSLHFAMLEAPDNRLMLTGPSPQVGKSFISANLAVICAQAGQKVLLVDADLRRGHIHRMFNDSAENGVSELLSGRIELSQAIRRSKKEDGLDYIARGSSPPNPSELLMHKNFTNFLEEVSKRYDLVIVDTPPVLAVTDSTIVGRQMGTTLLIVRFHVSPAKEVERAIQQLDSGGANVKGIIFNAVERTASASYGYGYSDYTYSYRSVED